MALQTLTSSSAFPTSTADSSGSDGDDGNDLGSRNSVPFSFLIAFLALFVAFMGLGLWARRIVFFARRRLGLPVPDETTMRRQVVRPKKPVLWDIYPDKEAHAEKWEAMEVSISASPFEILILKCSVKPLSVWYCREVPVKPTRPAYEPPEPSWPPPAPTARSLPRMRGPGVMVIEPPTIPSSGPRSWRDHLHAFDGVKEWWLDLADPMRHELPKNVIATKPEEVQVAVFVAMPSQHSIPDTHRRGAEQVGEVAIGISGTRWHYEDRFPDLLESRT